MKTINLTPSEFYLLKNLIYIEGLKPDIKINQSIVTVSLSQFFCDKYGY